MPRMRRLGLAMSLHASDQKKVIRFRKRAISGVKCVLALLDSKVSDGAIVTFLTLKRAARHDVVTVEMSKLAKKRKCSIKTIERHLKELRDVRIIHVESNSERGLKVANTYFIDDVNFAKIQTDPRYVKNVVGVPSVLPSKAKARKPIDFATAKAALRRGACM